LETHPVPEEALELATSPYAPQDACTVSDWSGVSVADASSWLAHLISVGCTPAVSHLARVARARSELLQPTEASLEALQFRARKRAPSMTRDHAALLLAMTGSVRAALETLDGDPEADLLICPEGER
jgi:hypothetical protein